MKKGLILLLLATAAQAHAAGAPQAPERRVERWSVSTNLLWDATATLNLGAELRTGMRTSVQLPVNYNCWSAGGDHRWRHILVQPELRWWRREALRGSFFGVHAHYAYFNVGGIPLGRQLKENRFAGSAIGAGISWGHRWQLAPSLGLEAAVGAGYARISYNKYVCGKCGELREQGIKHYVGPTRVGVSLIFGMARRTEPVREMIVVPHEPVAVVEPVFAPIVAAPEFTEDPNFIISFVMPPTEQVKARSASGKAYLDFAVGSSEIVADFHNNAQELAKIHELVGVVAADPDATITGITIIGHASPEGVWASNQELSQRRAQALQSHIEGVHRLPVGMIHAWGAGEDWEGLDSLVRSSSLSEKLPVLDIIRGTGVFDGRETRLMQLAGGAPYRRMKAEMFPALRRTDYSIAYTVAAFSIDRGREVFDTRPGNLSLNELYLVARSYDRGSERFSEVFETAARIYPDSDIANLNAAASALQRRDATSALFYIKRVRVQSPAYWNNMGILAWLQGYPKMAAECFERGGNDGGENLKMVNGYSVVCE